jgi:hypothetical protein
VKFLSKCHWNKLFTFVVISILSLGLAFTAINVSAEQVKIKSVVVKVGNDHVVVSLEEYAKSFDKRDSDLMQYLQNGQGFVSIQALVLNDKMISLSNYAKGYGNGYSVAAIYTNTEAITLANLKEFKGIQNGIPVTEPIQGVIDPEDFRVESIN